MIIDVANRGTLYEREVWNFEQALGWIGGLIGLIYVSISFAIKPCVSHAMVFKVSDNSKVAEAFGLNSYEFRFSHILYELPFTSRCCFSKHFN